MGARVPNEEAGRCGYDLRELCRVVRKEYEAKAEAEYLAQQGTHHQNENSTLFQESKIGRNHFTGVIEWQNEIRELKKSDGEPYSADYLENIHTQLSCLFNHAIKHYGLQINPAARRRHGR